TPVPAEVAAVRAAARRWQHDFVSRALSEPRRVVAHGVAPDARGRRLFDAVRARLATLHATLEVKVAAARTRLNAASATGHAASRAASFTRRSRCRTARGRCAS